LSWIYGFNASGLQPRPDHPILGLAKITLDSSAPDGRHQSAAILNNDTPSHDRMRTILIEGREKKGLSQVALSRLLGKYKNFVWKYEHRERKLDLVDFSKIAAVLGIDVQGAVQEIGLHAYDAEQPTPSRTNYASTPLTQKLGIRPHMRLYAMDAPANYAALLEPLPEGAKFDAQVSKSTDLIHVFVTKRNKLAAVLKSLRSTLKADAAVWISWPKRSSKQPTDVTADIVLDTALPFGLVEADVCTVDATWSALKFVTEKKVAPSALKRDR
jgi:transcriptional regulator with XRE-family HTH domain